MEGYFWAAVLVAVFAGLYWWLFRSAGPTAVLIIASEYSSRQKLAALCRPFLFHQLGDERAERRQLTLELGWKEVKEVGRFYDHQGSDTWYYYVYGGQGGGKRAFNWAASQACGKQITGDVVVVKSASTGHGWMYNNGYDWVETTAGWVLQACRWLISRRFRTIAVRDLVDSILFHARGREESMMMLPPEGRQGSWPASGMCARELSDMLARREAAKVLHQGLRWR